MSLTRADREIYYDIKMMIAKHGADMSPATRAALDNVIDNTTPPRLSLNPLDAELFTMISAMLLNGLRWRGWTIKDRALMVEMARQADHLERRRVARQRTLDGGL